MAYLYDRRIAKDVTLDLGWIEGMRKDFLTLMKNVDRVKNYRDADRLREAFKTFRKNFEDLVFETFLNRDFKYDPEVPEGDRKWYDRELRKSGWSFSTELRLPLGYPDNKYNPESEESLFASYEVEKTKWANRLKDRARDFWTDMKTFVEYRQNRAGTPSYTVKTRDVERIEMEGFYISIVGYDDNKEANDDYLARFREGLKIFRRNAQRVLPWMLQHMLPMQLNAYASLDEGGTYKGDHIEIALGGFFEHKNPNIVAHVIAHEMGHHIFKEYLSEADRKFWYEAIREDATPLDIEALLKVWPEGAWAYELVQKLKDTEPLLALQIDVISHGQGESGGPKFEKREEFEKLLEEGHKFVTVKHPITGYGGKNAEESFCEAIGRLVGYGPATVDPLVKHWLKLILPEVKVASTRETVRAALRRCT